MSEEPNLTAATEPTPGPTPQPSLDPIADPNPIMDLTQEDLERMLRRAIGHTLALGLVASLILWKAAGWRTAAMMATGAAISAVSILEWRRLIRFIHRVMEKGGPPKTAGPGADAGNADSGRKLTPRGGFAAAVFLVLRLTVFAGAIYGSLKCFRGSAVALICGLSLAMLAMLWEAIRLLRE